MAYSVLLDPMGIDWPLGFVQVAAAGTPVNIMANVDANNTNSPTAGAGAAWGSTVLRAEYTPTCHKVTFQGMKPGANNNGMIMNNGNVYIMRALGPGNQNSGGPGNRSDPGAMVYVLFPGGVVTIPGLEVDGPTISPYRYTIDVDNNNEGALVTLLNCVRG
jgi:hypothetical protein